MNWRKVMKRVIIPAVALSACASGAFLWRKGDALSEASQPLETTAIAKRGPIRQTVPCVGRVVSNLDVEIKCRASGEVIKLPCDVSDPVKKGDLLLELDPVDQERLVQQAEAALAASKARFAQAQSTLAVAEKSLDVEKWKAEAALQGAEVRNQDAAAKAKREEQLLEKKYSSPEGVETAQTAAVQAEQALKTAQANIEALKAQELDLETKRQEINLSKAQVDSNVIALSLAQRQLGYTKVFAPIDAVVSDRKIQIGQIISSGISNVGGGTTVMTISDLSRIYVLAAVDESNIGFVTLGQPAEITADSYLRKRFAGKVDRIATKGANLQNVVTFEVRIEVLNEDKTLLKPEMTTNVTIVVADKPDVIVLPVACIFRDKGDTFVALENPDGEIGQNRPIEIGITDGAQTEVASGVKEGDVVLVQQTEADSRWRTGDEHQDARRRMMMMGTMGGAMRGGRR